MLVSVNRENRLFRVKVGNRQKCKITNGTGVCVMERRDVRWINDGLV